MIIQTLTSPSQLSFIIRSWMRLKKKPLLTTLQAILDPVLKKYKRLLLMFGPKLMKNLERELRL